MTADWRDFSIDPDANVMAQPIGAPEGGFKGPWVNNIIRNCLAAVRGLGNTTLKLPANPTANGFPEGAESKAGTMSLQDRGSVQIDGGTIVNTSGVVPIRGIIPFSGTVVQAEAQEQYGWAICDGRTRNSIVTPDLQLLFLRGAVGNAGTIGGASSATSSTAGSHNHGASTGDAGAHSHGGSTATAGQHSHGGFTDVATGFGAVGGVDLDTGGSDQVVHRHVISSHDGHTHTISASVDHAHSVASDGSHTHTVSTLPPYYTVIWLMRVA
jgi:hypothetical protein